MVYEESDLESSGSASITSLHEAWPSTDDEFEHPNQPVYNIPSHAPPFTHRLLFDVPYARFQLTAVRQSSIPYCAEVLQFPVLCAPWFSNVLAITAHGIGISQTNLHASFSIYVNGLQVHPFCDLPAHACNHGRIFICERHGT